MPPWSRVIALCAIALFAVACSRKDDDEDERTHRKRRVAAGGSGSGGAGVTLGCPFGLCSGGLSGSGPEHVCKRMMDLLQTDAGAFALPKAGEKDLEQCVKSMEQMQKDQPKQYAVMEKCVDTATDMTSLVACMTQMYLDAGVP